jgi:hypothetical protein
MVIIRNYAAHVAQDKEISGDKLTKWLDSDKRLHDAIREDTISELLISLELDIVLVCKQKRSRKTTWEHVNEQLHRESCKIIDQEGLGDHRREETALHSKDHFLVCA